MGNRATQKFIIRKAVIADLPQIFRIRTSVKENHLSLHDLSERGVSIENTEARMKANEFGAWVAALDTKVIAFAFVEKADGNLWALFTDPEHEGQGCGTALLSKCEKWVTDLGLNCAILETTPNTNAARFYAKRGWIEYDKDEYQVFMRKSF